MTDTQAWRDLLHRIGASPADWRFTGHVGVAPPVWQVELADTGIEVDLDEIDIDPETGLYLFKGQQVLIYIKFARVPEETLRYDKAGSPRFHFRDCRTIQTMKRADRFQRYVAINRTDGRFPVVSRELETREQRELEAPLGPCKNCLKELNYKGYADRPNQRKPIWDRFAIDEFFAAYSSAISAIPNDCSNAVDPARYAEDWGKTSQAIRVDAGWQCRECRVVMSSHKRLLHVHHIDRDKQNNWRYNLEPLCALCHKGQPGHSNMYVSVRDTQIIQELRRKQRLGEA